MAIEAVPEQIKAVNYSLVDIFTQDTREKKMVFLCKSKSEKAFVVMQYLHVVKTPPLHCSI